MSIDSNRHQLSDAFGFHVLATSALDDLASFHHEVLISQFGGKVIELLNQHHGHFLAVQALIGQLANGSANGEHRCYIPDVEVQKERSAGDLEAGAAVDVTAKIFQELSERFNVKMDGVKMDGVKMDGVKMDGVKRSQPSKAQ